MEAREDWVRVHGAGNVLSYQPAAYSGQLADLSGYVERELARISRAMGEAQGGGALYLAGADSPAAGRVVPVTYMQLQDFSARTPTRYQIGVEPDVTMASLYLRETGQWGVAFTVTASIEAGKQYEVRMFRGATPSDLFVVSTKPAAIVQETMSGAGVIRVDGAGGGDVLSLWIREISGTGGTWATTGAYFIAWRVTD